MVQAALKPVCNLSNIGGYFGLPSIVKWLFVPFFNKPAGQAGGEIARNAYLCRIYLLPYSIVNPLIE